MGLAASLSAGACSRTGLPADGERQATGLAVAMGDGEGGVIEAVGGRMVHAGLRTCPDDDCRVPVCSTADSLDLLFVIDNSGSMAEEQEALREQLPRLVQVLTSGRRADGSTFVPAASVHVGVVNTDMGIGRVFGIDKCEGPGDDGVLANVVRSRECASPDFLAYADGDDPLASAEAKRLRCLLDVGTDGCGFEQQLEAGLKALWPSVDIDPETGEPWRNPVNGLPDNRITFTGDTLGHGDGANAGFLRNDPRAGLSIIAVILVTDEEDCSSLRTDHFLPPNQLAATDPLRSQDLNLRCFYNPDDLFDVNRYVQGFRALRPGNPDLVLFSAIVGVPADLVGPEVLSGVDFSDERSRNDFYDAILDDVRMRERVKEGTPPGQGALEASCNTSTGLAFPPRRIVQAARAFGENGLVQSICQSDFTPAVDRIIDRLSSRLGAACKL